MRKTNMSEKNIPRREADMYPLLRSWLEANGYSVNAEVNGVDIAARKGGGLVVIEMKLRINLDLVMQIAARQETASSVYAAVPAPRTWDRRWRKLMKLLKRLEAGLILVHMDSAAPRVEIAFHPVAFERKRGKNGKGAARALLAEMDGRTLELNVGGSVRAKRVTAYRENALLVAAGLERIGPCSPAELRALGTGKKTGEILYANHYGWFERLGKGLYGLAPAGRDGLREYAALAVLLRANLAP